MAVEYFLVINNERVGPLPEDKLLAAGMKADTLVWREGMENWMTASNVEGLKSLFPTVPVGGFTPGLPPTMPTFAPAMPARAAQVPQEMPYGAMPSGPPPAAAPWSRPYPISYGPPDPPRTFNLLYFWYIGVLGAAVALTIVFIVLMTVLDSMRGNRDTMEILSIFFVFTMVGLGIAYVVLQKVLLYKMWKQIQDGHASITPGMAVGLCFVPLFHLVWYFFAYYGLAKEQNGYLYRYGIPGRYSSEAMALTTCILNVIVLYINLIAVFILMPITMLFLKNTAMDIAQARLGRQTQGYGTPSY
jgi:hypothetical protein